MNGPAYQLGEKWCAEAQVPGIVPGVAHFIKATKQEAENARDDFIDTLANKP